MNYFDLVIILLLVITFYTGFKNGLIKSIFSTVGYISGGVAGLTLAAKYLATRESQTQKVLLALLAIFFGATIGKFFLGKMGSFFRKMLYIPPFNFIDSLLGALVSLIRTTFILCLVVIFLIFSRWDMAERYVKPSISFQIIQAQLPTVFITLKNHFG